LSEFTANSAIPATSAGEPVADLIVEESEQVLPSVPSLEASVVAMQSEFYGGGGASGMDTSNEQTLAYSAPVDDVNTASGITSLREEDIDQLDHELGESADENPTSMMMQAVTETSGEADPIALMNTADEGADSTLAALADTEAIESEAQDGFSLTAIDEDFQDVPDDTGDDRSRLGDEPPTSSNDNDRAQANTAEKISSSDTPTPQATATHTPTPIPPVPASRTESRRDAAVIDNTGLGIFLLLIGVILFSASFMVIRRNRRQ
jgi:hypothetical protein